MNFGWFIELSVQTFQPLILINRRDNSGISFGNVHHFIGHCLIPLDSTNDDFLNVKIGLEEILPEFQKIIGNENHKPQKQEFHIHQCTEIDR